MIRSLADHALRTLRYHARDLDHGKVRSAGWRAVERGWLSSHNTCAACGGTENLNVHHKLPFHLHPELELDPANLITLCMVKGRHCHIRIGHGDLFRNYNPDVVPDCELAIKAMEANDLAAFEAVAHNAKLKRL